MSTERLTPVLQRLIADASQLDPPEQELLIEMAAALQREIQVWSAPDSDIVGPIFQRAFASRLVLFHAMHDAALTKKTFEYMFCGASVSAGRTAVQSYNTVHAGADVVVDGVGFSLKTEGSRSARRHRVHISKLMEARWIRSCRSTDDFAGGVRQHVVRHLAEYQRILSLRSFKTATEVYYELVEIPHAVLAQMANVSASDFKPPTTNNSSSVRVPSSGQPDFTLTLDGSVEKVTIRNLRIDRCIRHATWTIDTSDC